MRKRFKQTLISSNFKRDQTSDLLFSFTFVKECQNLINILKIVVGADEREK